MKAFETNVLDGKSGEGEEKAAEVRACYDAIGKIVKLLGTGERGGDEMEEEVGEGERMELEEWVGVGCAMEVGKGGVGLVRRVLECKGR